MNQADLAKIPENLDEAVASLETIYKKERGASEGWKEFFSGDERKECIKQHHGIGQALRNAWLWDEKSPLHVWFSGMGIWHADDMSSIILKCLHRKLHDKPFEVEKQIESYKKYWAANS